MENGDTKSRLFAMEPVEFDRWLEAASVKEMSSAGEAVLKRLGEGGPLYPEEKRRIVAFYEKAKTMCWPFRLLKWMKYDFPSAAVRVFQAYLIAGKLLGAGPFCQMSWPATLLPITMWIAFRPFISAGGK